MNLLSNLAKTFSAGPDPILVNAGISGERFVAKIRLGLTAGLLAIPIVNIAFFSLSRLEVLVGLAVTGISFLAAIAVYFLAMKGQVPHWLSFVSSFFDVSLISMALCAFLIFGQPHTAVNSKVIFDAYFLAVAGTGLRYDPRVSFAAGLLATIEYLGLVTFASFHWDLNNDSFAPFPYGYFSWSAQIARLILLAAGTGFTIAIVSRSQKLLRMASLDPLTSLCNRGYIDDRFAIELSRAARYNQSLAIAVIDVDRFKDFNDTYGHAAGDAALRSLSALFRQSFRQSDTVGRYGGEEFVVLLPETTLESARQKMDAVRQLISETPITIPSGIETPGITISAGVAVFPDDGRTEADLFEAADSRLFDAKNSGRNLVVSSNQIAVAR